MWEGPGFGGNKPISCDLILKGCRSLGLGRGTLEEVGEPVRGLSNAMLLSWDFLKSTEGQSFEQGLPSPEQVLGMLI